MLSKQKIGFDLDGVFIGSPPFIPKKLIEALYKKSSNNLSYRIPGKIEQKIRLASHLPLLRPAIQKNVNLLAKLFKSKNISLILVSSRFSFLKKRTEQWGEQNKIHNSFAKTFFNDKNEQPHLFKNRIIKAEKIEKFIDDDLDLLKYLSENNPRVKFYWLTKDNKMKALPQNVYKITSLEELVSRYL